MGIISSKTPERLVYHLSSVPTNIPTNVPITTLETCLLICLTQSTVVIVGQVLVSSSSFHFLSPLSGL